MEISLRFYKKKLILFLLAISFSQLFSQSNSYNPDHLFSVDELKEDLHFYKNKLEKIHSNLYA